MSALTIASLAAIVIVISVVLYFVHVLGFDGSLLVTVAAYFIASLFGGGIRFGVRNDARP